MSDRGPTPLRDLIAGRLYVWDCLTTGLMNGMDAALAWRKRVADAPEVERAFRCADELVKLGIKDYLAGYEEGLMVGTRFREEYGSCPNVDNAAASATTVSEPN